MKQLLLYGCLPRSKIGYSPRSGSGDPRFHTWGLRSLLIQVHSMFASMAPEMWPVFPLGNGAGMTLA